MTTKVKKWGNSLAIRIPDEFAASLDLKDGSAVAFRLSKNAIVISPSRPVYTLEELVKGITKKNRHKLVWPDDEPRGKEVW